MLNGGTVALALVAIFTEVPDTASFLADGISVLVADTGAEDSGGGALVTPEDILRLMLGEAALVTVKVDPKSFGFFKRSLVGSLGTGVLGGDLLTEMELFTEIS